MKNPDAFLAIQCGNITIKRPDFSVNTGHFLTLTNRANRYTINAVGNFKDSTVGKMYDSTK